MGENKLRENVVIVSVPIPREIYIQFSMAVLRTEGPKKKTKVILDLMRHYVEELTRGQAAAPASLAFSSANPPATEGG